MFLDHAFKLRIENLWTCISIATISSPNLSISTTTTGIPTPRIWVQYTSTINKQTSTTGIQLAIVPTNRIKPNSHIQQRFINWGLVHVPWARRDMVGMPQACQGLVGARWNCRGLVGARWSYPRFGAYATKLLRFGVCAMSSLDFGGYVTGR